MNNLKKRLKISGLIAAALFFIGGLAVAGTLPVPAQVRRLTNFFADKGGQEAHVDDGSRRQAPEGIATFLAGVEGGAGAYTAPFALGEPAGRPDAVTSSSSSGRRPTPPAKASVPGSIWLLGSGVLAMLWAERAGRKGKKG